jgi:GMP synthase (glutamine-hydrolysing)
VVPNPNGRQLGLYDVCWEPAAHLDELFSTVATLRRGAHWNDDIVTRLPEGARVMARASTGEVQAARHAPTVWGVQWHPEAGEEIIRPWADHDRDDAVERGVDVDRYLGDVIAARDGLRATWRLLAERFVEICRDATHEGRTSQVTSEVTSR